MNTTLIPYFAAEKHGAMLLIALGGASLVGCYALWQSRSAFVPMIWPLVIFATFELVVGSAVAWRTPRQVQDLEAGMAQARMTTASAELARMERVKRNFRVVKVVEIAVIGLGVLALCVFPLGSTWYSVGLGFVLQGAALLVFDAFAHHRAEGYVQWLESI